MDVLLRKQQFEKGQELYEAQNFQDAEACFEKLAADAPEDRLAALYGMVCNFLAGEHSHTRLTAMWERFRPILEHCAPDSAVQAKNILTACTASTYRSCNAWQEAQYKALNAKANLDGKEFVLQKIQETLLTADTHYSAILDVLYGFFCTAAALEGQQSPEEAYYVSLLDCLQMALNLQTECGLENHISSIQAAKQVCAMAIPPEMQDARRLRNEILRKTLVGQEALDQWDYFAPFAREAEISMDSIRKSSANPFSRLKTWLNRLLQK